MRKLARFAIIPFLLSLAATAGAQTEDSENVVRPRLVAGTKAIEAGKPFMIGVHFEIQSGWHLYWENSGDAGFPIGVKWRVPPGFKVAPLRWPAPHRYVETGEMISFGYQDETMLIARVTPPAKLTETTVALAADLDWLVCETVCIPGDAMVELQLPVGKSAPSDDAGLISGFEAKVPRPSGAGPFTVKSAVATRQSGKKWLIRIDLAGGAGAIKDFFPRALPGFAINYGQLKTEGSAILIPVAASGGKPLPQTISGVLATSRGAFDLRTALELSGPESASSQEMQTDAAESGPAAGSETPGDHGQSPAPPTGSLAALPGSAGWLDRPFQIGGKADTSYSMYLIVALALLGGLLLNVMPCVLPVLSLKILSFVHQAGESRQRTRSLGLWFAGGVLVSFGVLATTVVALRAAGQQIGWGFQFQSPAFVVLMSTIVLVFALNLLGVFEITGPAIGTGVLQKEGATGAFFNGVLATVLATPCTAPFLGTALGFAFSQPAGVIFLVFTAAGVGLALPYILLSWNPGWLKIVPRPGVWMIRLKEAMGFLLIATLIWLLSVLGSQMGAEGIVWTCVFLLAVAVGTWLIGRLTLETSAQRRILTWGAALLLVGLSYFWAFEVELRWRDAGPVSATAGRIPGGAGQLDWKPFSLMELERRVTAGETVFIDFTADWCWTCKVNERTVLGSEIVRERLSKPDVVAMKADWTNRNPEITRLLAKFGRAGVPYYVIFPAGRLTEPIALNEVITSGSVIEALDRAMNN